jgi:hypothetical protein
MYRQEYWESVLLFWLGGGGGGFIFERDGGKTV